MSTMGKRSVFPKQRLAAAMLGVILVGVPFISTGCATSKQVDGGPAVLPKKFPGGGAASASKPTEPPAPKDASN